MQTTQVQVGDTTMERTVIGVQGMTCEGCSRTLTDALYAVPGVQYVLVDRPNTRATIQYDPAKTAAPALAKVIEDAGYDVVAA